MENAQKVEQIIRSQNGKAVSVKFIKRSTGEERILNGRLGVKSKLKNNNGADRVYDPADYNLLTLYDLRKQEYRSIPLDNVKEIVANGQVYYFKR